MKGSRGKAIRGILFLCVVFSFVALTSFEAVSGPQKKDKEGVMSGNEQINAVLSCWGYGYKVKMLVNGTDMDPNVLHYVAALPRRQMLRMPLIQSVRKMQ